MAISQDVFLAFDLIQTSKRGIRGLAAERGCARAVG